MARFMANRLLKILTNHYILHTFWVCGLGCGVWGVGCGLICGVWSVCGVKMAFYTTERQAKNTGKQNKRAC